MWGGKQACRWGGGKVCKKVLLLPQNGVILVRPIGVGLGQGYINLYIRLSLSRPTVNMVKTPTDYFSPSCGGGGGGVENRPVVRGGLQKIPFWATKWASRPTVNMVKTPTDYFSPSCGGGGQGVENRPVARGVYKKLLFWPQNGPKMVLF